jgi:hypothetical protein
MIVMFLKSLAKKVKKMRILKTYEINIDFIIREHELQEKMNHIKFYGSIQSNYENLVDDDFSIIDVSNKEASKYYEFNRILSQENYDLGKNISDFIKEFKRQTKNTEEAIRLMPMHMKELYKFTDDCISTFYCYFNFGKSNTERMLPYCRPAVEKFIFNKIYPFIYDMYRIKYQEDNTIFLINQNTIKIQKSPIQILKDLEVEKSFIDQDEDDRRMIPFKSTVDCINKIEFEVCPKDKFETLMKASLDMRNCILDITKGKVYYAYIG